MDMGMMHSSREAAAPVSGIGPCSCGGLRRNGCARVVVQIMQATHPSTTRVARNRGGPLRKPYCREAPGGPTTNQSCAVV